MKLSNRKYFSKIIRDLKLCTILFSSCSLLSFSLTSCQNVDYQLQRVNAIKNIRCGLFIQKDFDKVDNYFILSVKLNTGYSMLSNSDFPNNPNQNTIKHDKASDLYYSLSLKEFDKENNYYISHNLKNIEIIEETDNKTVIKSTDMTLTCYNNFDSSIPLAGRVYYEVSCVNRKDSKTYNISFVNFTEKYN